MDIGVHFQDLPFELPLQHQHWRWRALPSLQMRETNILKNNVLKNAPCQLSHIYHWLLTLTT